MAVVWYLEEKKHGRGADNQLAHDTLDTYRKQLSTALNSVFEPNPANDVLVIRYVASYIEKRLKAGFSSTPSPIVPVDHAEEILLTAKAMRDEAFGNRQWLQALRLAIFRVVAAADMISGRRTADLCRMITTQVWTVGDDTVAAFGERKNWGSTNNILFFTGGEDTLSELNFTSQLREYYQFLGQLGLTTVGGKYTFPAPRRRAATDVEPDASVPDVVLDKEDYFSTDTANTILAKVCENMGMSTAYKVHGMGRASKAVAISSNLMGDQERQHVTVGQKLGLSSTRIQDLYSRLELIREVGNESRFSFPSARFEMVHSQLQRTTKLVPHRL
jgi:hypothetical protein